MSIWDYFRDKDSVDKAMFGQKGFKVVNSGNSPLAGKFSSVQAWNGDLTLSAVTAEGDDLPSGTLKSGGIVRGPFTSIDVTVGTGLAYQV